MSLTISAAQVASFIANPSSFSGYSATSHVIVSGSITHADATLLNSVDATYIQATIAQTTAANLAAIQTNNSTRTSTNKFTVSTNDTSASAAVLNSVKGITSITPDFSSINGITASSSSDITSLYSDTNATLGNETVIVNDTSIAAATLSTINAATTAKVTTTAATITGTVTAVSDVFAAGAAAITTPAGVAVTITDTTVDALDLVALDDDGDVTNGDQVSRYTTGIITVNSANIIGTNVAITNLLSAPYGVAADANNPARFNNVKNKNIILDDPAVAGTTAYSATDIRAVQALVTAGGTVTATTNSATIALLTHADNGLLAGAGHNITVPDITNDTIAAASLVAVDAATSQVLTFDPAGGAASPALTGSAADIKALYASSGITTGDTKGLGSSAININSGLTSVADANSIAGSTSGVVTATILGSTMSAVAGLTETGNIYTLTIGDQQIAAADLVALVAKIGTGTVNITAATQLTGTLDDLHSLYVTNAARLTGEGIEALIVTDSNLDAAKLIALNAANTGSITVSATNITGSTADVKTVLTNADGGNGVVTGLAANITVTTSGATVAAADLNDIRGVHANGSGTEVGLTTGLVTIGTDATTISGTAAEVKEAFVSTNPPVTNPVTPVRIAGLGTLAASVSGTVALADINTIAAATTGVLTCTGADGALSAYTHADTGLLESGNAISFDLTDNTLNQAQVTSLIALSAKTTGTITLDPANGNASPTISATMADLLTVFADAGIAGKGGAAGTVTISDAGSVNAADLKTLNTAVTPALVAANVTNITGTIADLQNVYDAAEGGGATITAANLGNESVTVTDLDVSASALKTFVTANGAGVTRETTGAITVISSGITGSYADVNDMLTISAASNVNLSGLGAANANITGSPTVTEVNTIAGKTTGTVTATFGAAALSTYAALATAPQNYTISVNDASLAAGALNTLDGKTTGTVTVTVGSSVVGSATDITTAYASSGISGLSGTAAITVTGAPTATQINSVADLTTGQVNATVVGQMSDLLTITETTNALTLSVSDSVISATDLVALKAKTTGTVTVPADSTISGNFADVIAALGTAGINGLAAVGTTITDAITGAQVKQIVDLANANGTITATISSQYYTDASSGADTGLDQIVAANRAGAYTINFAGTTAQVLNVDGTVATAEVTTASEANLTALDALTTLDIAVTSNVSGLTGTAARIANLKTLLANAGLGASAVADPTISGLGAVPITVTGTISVADGNILAAATTGVVTAALTNGALSTFTQNVGGNVVPLIASGNSFTFTITDDGTLTAAQTSQIAALVAANNAGTALITIDPADGSVADLTGSMADLKALCAASFTNAEVTAGATRRVLGLADATLIVNDTGTVSVDDLMILANETSGAVTSTASDAVSGTKAGALAALTVGTSGIVGIHNTTTPLTLTDAATVAEVEALDALTDGVITATISDTTIALLSGITAGTNVYAVTVSDASVTAAALNTLNTATAGLVTVNSGTITGAYAALNTAFGNNNGTAITGLDDIAVTMSGSNSVANTNTIDGFTTGVVTTTVSDNDMTTLAGLSGTGNAYTISVTDGSVDAAALAVLNGKTTGVVSLTSTVITGALSDVKAVYEANTAGEISGLGNEVVAVSDTGTISAADLKTVNGLTTGVVTLTGVTGVTGTLADIKAAYAANTAGTVTGLGNEAISISDLGTIVTASDVADIEALTSGTVTVALSGTSITAATLNSLDASSTQTVNVGGVATVTGSASAINTAYASSGLDGLGNEAVTLSDTTLTATTLNTVDGNTTGSVDAGTVTTLTGSITDVTASYASSGLTGLGNEAVTLSDTTASASALNTLDGNTTGTIDASKLTKLTGTSTDAQTAFSSSGISGLTFDASSYLAGYSDLLAAFGTDLTAARTHYFAHGITEGRSFDAFDETSYLAGHSDLLAAFGTNTDKALVHYLLNGYSEGRTVDAFDENSYLASNTSLIGSTSTADAAAHYVNTGYAAGLALDTFDENSYLASNTSLIGTVSAADATAHYVSTGYSAGLAADSFDELGYIASHTDLIAAFGTDGAAATQHFITYGSTEGRTVTFDAASYLAAHADLRVAFGTDQGLAKQHYINYGSDEGRTLA